MQNNQVFICQITGLATTFNIPSIENKGVLYNSPISQVEVAAQYAEESYKTLQTLPSSVLSAVLLSLLNDKHLIEDKLSAYERNVLLSTLPKYDIVQAIHIVFKLDKKSRKFIPSYSLYHPDAQTKEELLGSFQAYIKTIRQNLTGTYYNENPEATIEDDSTEFILSIKTSKASNFKSQKEAFKNLLSQLQESELSQAKVLPYLKTISQNSNLAEASVDIRVKIIKNLKEWLSSDIVDSTKKAILSVISILEKTSPKQLKDYKLETVTAHPVAKKSLKEILAEKQNRSIEAKPISDPFPSNASNTSNAIEEDEMEQQRELDYYDREEAEEEGEYNDF